MPRSARTCKQAWNAARVRAAGLKSVMGWCILKEHEAML
jgi:hypothetical protein